VIVCPVCGNTLHVEEGGLEEFEEETYFGEEGAEMKLRIPYCNEAEDCSAVHAANTMDRIAEDFFDVVGRR
jgi:hypothetical protein